MFPSLKQRGSMQLVGRPLAALIALALVAAVPAIVGPALAAEAPPAGPEPAPTSTAAADTGMALEGGKDGTAFGSLTVEGENRIRIEFERPELEVDIDPQQAPGLEWGSVMDVLNRSVPDLVSPLLAVTAGEPSPYLPRPWLDVLGAGPVARFRPAVEKVEEWRLMVVDSHGQEVASFTGKGKPPAEIAWDGRTVAGGMAQPGLTYSYVFEARDRAGNRRRFVGDGFQVPPYRCEQDSDLLMLASGRQLLEPGGGRTPLLLEMASRLGLTSGPGDPVVVQVTARSFDVASTLGKGIEAALRDLLPGGPGRLSVQTQVEAGAPADGTVLVSTGRGR